MNLSVKEKEKYVLKLREEGKTYRDIAHELLISPREISKILKKANGEIEEKERKKIVLSKTAKALQLYKKGENPIEVVIKLDLSPQDAHSLYLNYLSLNKCHHFIETFKQYDNDTLQSIIDCYDFMKENGIDKKEIVEAIKISNDFPKIKEEFNHISEQIIDLSQSKEVLYEETKFLLHKNAEMNNELNSNQTKIDSNNIALHLIEDKINKKRQLLNSINNSKDYNDLKNKIKEHSEEFLKQKRAFCKIAIMTILQTIKKDPDKNILIKNLENSTKYPFSENYLLYYQQKISEMADKLYDNIAETVTNNIMDS